MHYDRSGAVRPRRQQDCVAHSAALVAIGISNCDSLESLRGLALRGSQSDLRISTPLDVCVLPNYARRMVRAASRFSDWLLVMVVLASLACESKSAPDSEQKPGAAVTSGNAPAGAQPARPAAAPSGTCPAGRWSYDYSDQALETLLKKLPETKVVKEEGAFICDVPAGTQGTITCATQGKPVVNVVETNQGGMKMIITVTIDGRATNQFQLLDGGRMNVLSSDISGLRITTEATLAGRKMPFPTEKLIGLFGDPGSKLAYKCEGNRLLLNSQPESAAPVWQTLEPAN